MTKRDCEEFFDLIALTDSSPGSTGRPLEFVQAVARTAARLLREERQAREAKEQFLSTPFTPIRKEIASP
jgi:hypothetical protein